jgi:Phage integrase family
MRRGELCALRWPRVRLDEATLLVNRNYVQRGTTRKEKDTKTHQSRRIALDEVTVAILTEHLERCRARAAAVGVGLAASAYVFSSAPDGATPLLPDSVTQRYRRLAKRLGIASTLHDLRHFSDDPLNVVRARGRVRRSAPSPLATVDVARLRHRPVECVLGPPAERVQQLPDDTGIGHGLPPLPGGAPRGLRPWGNAAPTTAACSSNTVAQTPSRAITTANATCTILREAIRQTPRRTSGSVEVPNISRARAKTACVSSWNPAATAADGLVRGMPGRRSSPQMHTASSRRKTCQP